MSNCMLLVDSLEAVKAAQADHPQGILATDNPLLADHLAENSPVVDMESMLSPEDADRIGHLSIDLAIRIDEKLNCPELMDACGFPNRNLRMASATTRLLSGQIYRATALTRGLIKQNPEHIGIYCQSPETPNGTLPVIPERFHVAWPQLARYGFFGSRTIDVKTIGADTPQSINDTASRNLARRLVGLPLTALLGVIAAKPAVSRVLQALGRPAVVLESDNEAIRETLGHLTMRGVAIVKMDDRRAIKPSTGHIKSDAIAPIIEPLISDTVSEHLSALDEFNAEQISALTKLFVSHYAGGIEKLIGKVPSIRQSVRQALAKTGNRTVVIGNCIFGAEGAKLFETAREEGVPLLGFEHGITCGLSRHTEAKIEFSESTYCDELFVSSEASAKSHAKAGSKSGKLIVAGLAEQVRRMQRPRLQRYLARRAVGLMKNTPTAMHVDTVAFQGNMRAGPFAYTERGAVELHQRLVREAYAPLEKWHVLFKQYPTQRFPFEPRCSSYAGSPENISYTHEEDFRYLRAAADVLVTMMPTSTLGWCVGSNIPLVWLDSPITPLVSSEQTQAFRESFFVVDMRENNWPQTLRALLEKGPEWLRSEWKSKEAIRRQHLEQLIVGPSEPVGRAASRYIMDQLRAS